MTEIVGENARIVHPDWEPLPPGCPVFVVDRSCLPEGVLPEGFDYLLIQERSEDEGESVAIASHNLGALRLLVAGLKPSSITLARAIANPDAVVAALRDLDPATH